MITAPNSNLNTAGYQPISVQRSVSLATPIQRVAAATSSDAGRSSGDNASLASPREAVRPAPAARGAELDTPSQTIRSSGGDSFQFSGLGQDRAALATDTQRVSGSDFQYQSLGQGETLATNTQRVSGSDFQFQSLGQNASLETNTQRVADNLNTTLTGGRINPTAIGLGSGATAELQNSGSGPVVQEQSISTGSVGLPEFVAVPQGASGNGSASQPVRTEPQTLAENGDNNDGAIVSTPEQPVREDEEELGPGELTESEEDLVDRLRARDQEVRTHEEAHLRAAGSLANGGANYEYQRGPDGRRYAVGGSVNIEVSPESDPRDTIQKADRIKRAALAPAEPSSKDRQVAARADRMKLEAQRALSEERLEDTTSEEGEDGNSIDGEGSDSGLGVEAPGDDENSASSGSGTDSESSSGVSAGNSNPSLEFSNTPLSGSGQSNFQFTPLGGGDTPAFQFKPLGGGDEPAFQFKPLGGGDTPAFQFKPLGGGEEPAFQFKPLGGGGEEPAFQFQTNPLAGNGESSSAIPGFQPFQLGNGQEAKPRFQIGNAPTASEGSASSVSAEGPTFIQPGSAPPISSFGTSSESNTVTYNINGRSEGGANQRPFDSISLIA